MSRKRIGMAAAAVIALGGGIVALSAPSGAGAILATAELRDGTGLSVGEVHFRVKNRNVVGEINVQLPADSSRFHGFHLHANDDPTNGVGCEGPSFVSADGHWNPTAATHGNHKGDLPPLVLGQDGRSHAEFNIGHLTPGEIGDLAVIVHAGPDNLANISTRYSAGGVPGPDATTLATGDAGTRFACGVVKLRGAS